MHRQPVLNKNGKIKTWKAKDHDNKEEFKELLKTKLPKEEQDGQNAFYRNNGGGKWLKKLEEEQGDAMADKQNNKS